MYLTQALYCMMSWMKKKNMSFLSSEKLATATGLIKYSGIPIQILESDQDWRHHAHLTLTYH